MNYFPLEAKVPDVLKAETVVCDINLKKCFSSFFPSVSVLIFNTSSHCFVLVKQFRPGKFPTTPINTVQLLIFLLLSPPQIQIVAYPVGTFTGTALRYNPCLFNWVPVTMQVHKQTARSPVTKQPNLLCEESPGTVPHRTVLNSRKSGHRQIFLSLLFAGGGKKRSHFFI